MVVIYAIEDINDLIYVGSTKKKLYQRLSGHRNSKKSNTYRACSSKKLNLEYEISEFTIKKPENLAYANKNKDVMFVPQLTYYG